MAIQESLKEEFTAFLKRIASRTQSAVDVSFAGNTGFMTFKPSGEASPEDGYNTTASPFLPDQTRSAASDIRTIFGEAVRVEETLAELSLDGTMQVRAIIRDEAGVRDALDGNNVLRLLDDSTPA